MRSPSLRWRTSKLAPGGPDSAIAFIASYLTWNSAALPDPVKHTAYRQRGAQAVKGQMGDFSDDHRDTTRIPRG
jgi:hypothetical protein